MKNKKGNAFVWVASIGALAVIALAYLTMTQAFNATTDAIDQTGFTTAQNTTFAVILNSWNWWPALMIVGVIFYVVMNTLRRDTYGGAG